MHFNTLKQWLDWQMNLHPRNIELELTRCRTVAQRLNLLSPSFPIISVAGTNGKGSSVILLEAILSAEGYQVGRYTSPHLLRYNERICVAGQEASDTMLCEVFEQIETVREEISLTFFEFATLAAILIFKQNQVDIAVLEVGLGGRLDAVNTFDADIALITAIDIDHVQWLGDNRESIGFEKAGIFRSYRPAVCSDRNPPKRLIQYAEQLHSPLYYLDRDFSYSKNGESDTWSWQYHQPKPTKYLDLPLPRLAGEFQLQNAAGVLMVSKLLNEQLSLSKTAIDNGLIKATLPGRFQRLPHTGMHILDVAHNPLGAQALKQLLEQNPTQGQTHMIIGMLQNKDIKGFLTVLYQEVTHWHVATLKTAQSTTPQQLIEVLTQLGAKHIQSYPSITAAYTQLLTQSSSADRIIVCGSFYAVSEVLALEEV